MVGWHLILSSNIPLLPIIKFWKRKSYYVPLLKPLPIQFRLWLPLPSPGAPLKKHLHTLSLSSPYLTLYLFVAGEGRERKRGNLAPPISFPHSSPNQIVEIMNPFPSLPLFHLNKHSVKSKILMHTRTSFPTQNIRKSNATDITIFSTFFIIVELIVFY